MVIKRSGNDKLKPEKMTMTYTTEQIKRINSAKKETVSMLNKEMGYSEDLRNQDRLDFLNGHIEKLNKMLNS